MLAIALRRIHKLILPTPAKGTATISKAEVATFNLNLQSLGYTLSADALRAFLNQSAVTSHKLFDDVLSILKELKGVRRYMPMYPNFPKQVIEASAAELYLNAMMHYLSFILVDVTEDSNRIWLPTYVKDKREPLDEKIELQVIGLATPEDLDIMTERIATSNTSLSASDKEELRTLLLQGNGNMNVMFPAMKNKENMSFVAATLMHSPIDLTPYFKTATDVLRLATALSDGDVSLSDDSKFRSFKRGERRFLLGLLETTSNTEEDMLRWRERWIRLGERLHPGEFRTKFPKVATAFSKLRNNEHIDTFNSKVENLLVEGSGAKIAAVLSQRPGDFARRLDHTLRTATRRNMTVIVNAFETVVTKVSTPVLLQVMAHFEHREDMRVVMPKGNVAKVMSLVKELPALPEVVTSRVVELIKSALVERFSALPKLGKVFIDPTLKDCLVPFSQRSASKTLRTLVRGSKLPLGEDKNIVRFFIWWKDMDTTGSWSSRVDLDLSAVAFSADWSNLGAIAFYNMRDTYAVHSGDITSAPTGASEFIDLNIPKAIKAGVRYVVMTVHGYTDQNFSDLPECFAGFMLRETAQSGEVYEPSTVMDKADVTMAARSGVPLIIDLVDRKVIWVDAAISRDRVSGYHGYHTAESTKGSIELLGKAFTNMHKPNLFDLLSLHVEGRGKLVKDASKADVNFSVEAGTPFELDRIASEFMTEAINKPKKSKAARA